MIRASGKTMRSCGENLEVLLIELNYFKYITNGDLRMQNGNSGELRLTSCMSSSEVGLYELAADVLSMLVQWRKWSTLTE
ncbi:hypothetical protein C2S51_038721 [Perilla frutescens var. frutescens]|nr:hypothetical protein C2S51_038721 [Perilla frutescens var. frutescens]